MSTDSEVVLDGDWVRALRPKRRWYGVLRASEPFVVLLAGASPGRIVWAKARSIGERVDLAVRFYLHDLDHSGSRAQVSLHVGDGYVQDLVVKTEWPELLPNYVMPMNLRFGVFQEVFEPHGIPPTSVKLLPLRRSWVKMGRNGIWRVREPYLEQIPPDLAPIVMEGRSGDTARRVPQLRRCRQR